MQAIADAQVRRTVFSSLWAETSPSRLLFSVVLVSLLIPLSSEAATYYTKKTGNDGNSCAAAQNASTPKLTINAGKNCLTNPGDTLIIGDGTYVEAEIAMKVSGTQANPITIKAENPLQAILSSTSSCNPNISIYADWITIDGILSQVSASDVQCPTGRNSASGAFVRVWDNNPGAVIKNCQVDYSSHRGVGIKSNSDNTIVENCVMHQSLEGMYGANQIFRNNYIDTPDIWGDHFTCKGGARNCQFYNNTIVRTTGSRLLTLGGNSGNQFLYDPPSGVECYNCVAYNNVVINNGAASSTLSIIGFVACQDCTIMNNVVIGGGGGFFSGYGGASGGVQILPINPRAINNIFDCGGGAAIGGYDGTKNTGTRVTDSNIWYNCTGVPTGTNQLTSNPLFVNRTSDWHPQAGSPGIGTGATVTMAAYPSGSITVNTDRDGATRTASWSRGIYNGGTAQVDTTPPSAPTGLRIQ